MPDNEAVALARAEGHAAGHQEAAAVYRTLIAQLLELLDHPSVEGREREILHLVLARQHTPAEIATFAFADSDRGEAVIQ
jgi:hypothetical protein